MNRPRCYNSKPPSEFLEAPNGYSDDGRRRMKTIRHILSTKCQQWGALGEARLKFWNCDGCERDPR